MNKIDKIDKSLEEAAYKYSFDSRPSIYGQVDVIDDFKAGAEWQKEQMMKNAVEGDYDCDYYAPAIFLDKNLDGIKDGDKVHIVVLKAEEE